MEGWRDGGREGGRETGREGRETGRGRNDVGSGLDPGGSELQNEWQVTEILIKTSRHRQGGRGRVQVVHGDGSWAYTTRWIFSIRSMSSAFWRTMSRRDCRTMSTSSSPSSSCTESSRVRVMWGLVKTLWLLLLADQGQDAERRRRISAMMSHSVIDTLQRNPGWS